MKINTTIFGLLILLLAASGSSQNIGELIQQNKLEELKEVVSKNPELIRIKDKAGRQPIHLVASSGFLAMFNYLLAAGADANDKTDAGSTPLHFAALNGHLDIVQCLIDKGVELDVKNNQSTTPLYLAAMRGHTQVMSVLINRGADVDATDLENGTPLQAAAQAGQQDAVKMLAEKGASVMRRDSNGLSALHFACQSGNATLIHYLLEKGLDLEAADSYGKTPLTYALEQGHDQTAQMVWQRMRHIKDYRISDGSTYLHAAAMGKCRGIVAPLIAVGLPVNADNLFKMTPLDYARNINDSAMVTLLEHNGGKSNSFPPSERQGPYIGEKPPGQEPILFAPGFISTPFANERDVQWTADGKTLYFTRWNANDWDVMQVSQKQGQWSQPVKTSFCSPFLEAEAYLTPDENRVFFVSNRPEDGQGTPGAWEIWYCQKLGADWGSARLLGPAFKSGFYTTFTSKGTMYLTLDNKMQKADAAGSGFDNPAPLPASVNGEAGGYNGFVAPDESYLIFSEASDADGFGEGDLYISFHQGDGSWTKAMNMGRSVNSFARDYCPSVSPDGRYFFFSSRRLGSEDVFWMDAKVISELKNAAVQKK